jgi:hypothetical protein
MEKECEDSETQVEVMDKKAEKKKKVQQKMLKLQ